MNTKICEVCGDRVAYTCTNARCFYCHDKHCTPGGNTAPGHGRGPVATPHAKREPKP